ncbi:hypothetical protein I5V28_05290 [Stenotrophomonas maltophilia]|nr:hypothetical protein [Stenotrophomonas maltophilia]
MSQIIVFPRGQLTAGDRKRMAEAGIVAVEADDPSSVVTVVPGAPLASSDDLAIAALSAIATCGWDEVAGRFVKALHGRLAAREAKAVPHG